MLLASAIGVPAARAEAPEGLHLEWEAPPSCPAAAYVREQITQAIGEGVEQVEALHASARVEQADGRWSARVEMGPGAREGRRTVSGQTCEEVAEAAALIIALQVQQRVQPTLPSPPAPGSEATDPPSTHERSPAADEPAALDAPRPERHRAAEDGPSHEPDGHKPASGASGGHGENAAPRWDLGAAMLWDRGSLPGWGLGAGVQVGRRWEAFRLSLEPHFIGPKRATLSPSSDAGGNFLLVGAQLSGCVEHDAEQWALQGCVGLDGGALRGKGSGVPNPQTSTALRLALEGGLTLLLPIKRWLWLRMRAGMQVAIVRSRYELHVPGAHTPARLAGRLGVGPELRF